MMPARPNPALHPADPPGKYSAIENTDIGVNAARKTFCIREIKHFHRANTSRMRDALLMGDNLSARVSTAPCVLS